MPAENGRASASRPRRRSPVYAFDKLVVPVGTEVNGKVTAIDRVLGRQTHSRGAQRPIFLRRKFQVTFQ